MYGAVEQLDVSGVSLTITPIPAIPMLRLTRRVAAALAAQKSIASTVTMIAKSDAKANDEAFWIGVVEQIVTAIDGALLDDFLKEASKVVKLSATPKVTGEAVFSVFDGDLLGLFTVLYHVVKVSGFSSTLFENR